MKVFKLFPLALVALCAFMEVAGAAEPGSNPERKAESESLSPPSSLPTSSGQAVNALPPADANTGDAGTGILGVLNCCPAPECCLLAGAGLYVMQARFDNNMAFGIQGTANQAGGTVARVAQRVDIDHQMVAAPQIWLGFITEEGLGARLRYWYFREGTDQVVSAANGGNSSPLLFSAAPLGLSLMNGASVMIATSKLQLQVWDAEGLYKFNAAKWNGLLSAGVRFAQIDQAYDAFVPRSGNNTLLSSNKFSGAGPTFALELRHPLCKSCLSLYGSARYSLVFGSGQQQASIPDQNVFSQDNRNAGIGIAEMEFGLEYKQSVGRSQLFGQVAVVGQNWSGAGSASRSSVNVLPGGAFAGAAYTGDSDINFIGLTVRLGVNY